MEQRANDRPAADKETVAASRFPGRGSAAPGSAIRERAFVPIPRQESDRRITLAPANTRSPGGPRRTRASREPPAVRIPRMNRPYGPTRGQKPMSAASAAAWFFRLQRGRQQPERPGQFEVRTLELRGPVRMAVVRRGQEGPGQPRVTLQNSLMRRLNSLKLNVLSASSSTIEASDPCSFASLASLVEGEGRDEVRGGAEVGTRTLSCGTRRESGAVIKQAT